jgi:hypothetical protein
VKEAQVPFLQLSDFIWEKAHAFKSRVVMTFEYLWKHVKCYGLAQVPAVESAMWRFGACGTADKEAQQQRQQDVAVLHSLLQAFDDCSISHALLEQLNDVRAPCSNTCAVSRVL